MIHEASNDINIDNTPLSTALYAQQHIAFIVCITLTTGTCVMDVVVIISTSTVICVCVISI